MAVTKVITRKILAFHFNLMPTSMLGQFCFDLFEAGLESDEICYFAGYASDLDRYLIKRAIESTLAKHELKMPSYGDESSLCLLWYYVENYGIDFNKLDFETLSKIASFVFSHSFSFCEPYEGVAYTMYQIEDDYQLSLCYYSHDESARLLAGHIHEFRELYSFSLSQPYFQQFINQTE